MSDKYERGGGGGEGGGGENSDRVRRRVITFAISGIEALNAIIIALAAQPEG